MFTWQTISHNTEYCEWVNEQNHLHHPKPPFQPPFLFSVRVFVHACRVFFVYFAFVLFLRTIFQFISDIVNWKGGKTDSYSKSNRWFKLWNINCSVCFVSYSVLTSAAASRHFFHPHFHAAIQTASVHTRGGCWIKDFPPQSAEVLAVQRQSCHGREQQQWKQAVIKGHKFPSYSAWLFVGLAAKNKPNSSERTREWLRVYAYLRICERIVTPWLGNCDQANKVTTAFMK